MAVKHARDGMAFCRSTSGKCEEVPLCAIRQVTALSWQLRCGKEQRIPAAAGTHCDERLGMRIARRESIYFRPLPSTIEQSANRLYLMSSCQIHEKADNTYFSESRLMEHFNYHSDVS